MLEYRKAIELGARIRFAKNPALSWNEHRAIDLTSLIFTTCYSDSLY